MCHRSREWPCRAGGRTNRIRAAHQEPMTTQIAELPGQRERIDTYLERSGLASKTPRVVPLTGDASDRRYYRVIIADEPSIVLSLYSAPFAFESLSFVNVAR